MQRWGDEVIAGEGDVKKGERCGLGGFFCRFLLIDTS